MITLGFGVSYSKGLVLKKTVFWPDYVFIEGRFGFKNERGQQPLISLKALGQSYGLNLSDSGSQFGFWYSLTSM